MPVNVSLEELDEEALVRILTEPKNSLVKQYKVLFGLDGVELEFEDEALKAIAAKAMERKTGARGLRAIVENATLDLMYNIPSEPEITKCIITKAVVDEGADPLGKELEYKGRVS